MPLTLSSFSPAILVKMKWNEIKSEIRLNTETNQVLTGLEMTCQLGDFLVSQVVTCVGLRERVSLSLANVPTIKEPADFISKIVLGNV